MSISVGYHAFDCKRYQPNGTNSQEVMPAIIGPHRIIEDINDEGARMQVVLSACSNFHHCKNPVCGFSSYLAKVKEE